MGSAFAGLYCRRILAGLVHGSSRLSLGALAILHETGLSEVVFFTMMQIGVSKDPSINPNEPAKEAS